MEQILAFVLGVSAGVIVWTVVVAFKTVKLSKQNEESIRNVEEWILRNDDSVNRRIDQEVDRVNQIATDCIRHTDSRVDRLEQKYLDQTKSKKLIKG